MHNPISWVLWLKSAGQRGMKMWSYSICQELLEKMNIRLLCSREYFQTFWLCKTKFRRWEQTQLNYENKHCELLSLLLYHLISLDTQIVTGDWITGCTSSFDCPQNLEEGWPISSVSFVCRCWLYRINLESAFVRIYSSNIQKGKTAETEFPPSDVESQ